MVTSLKKSPIMKYDENAQSYQAMREKLKVDPGNNFSATSSESITVKIKIRYGNMVVISLNHKLIYKLIRVQ